MRLTLGDGTTIDIEPGDVLSTVRYRCDTYGRNSQVLTDDVVAWLRAMLRDVVGPSIDDVREVWGVDDPANCVCAFDRARWRWSVWLYDADGRPTTYSGSTEREALQAAYDAGVAQRGGTTP